MSRWDDAMANALALAKLSIKYGEVPVGAVVLDSQGKMIASGTNEKERNGDPTAHAEIVAIRNACKVRGDGWRLMGCTLVVTLEPCLMCAGAIVASRLERVVFGAFDGKAGAVGSVWDVIRDPLLNHQVQVSSGIMADVAAAQLHEFFSSQR